MALLYNDMSFFRSTFLPDNILPRLTMWHQVVVELFPKNIFGVGTGTMLWPYPNIIQPKMNAVGGELAHLYFIGAHNSFITLFGRFGVLYLIAHLMIYTVIFKNYFDIIRKIKLNNDTILFFIFISSTIIAFLNVSFESPIHASFYWLSLGLVSCSYRNLRAQSENNFFI